jgi:hypothetical protein
VVAEATVAVAAKEFLVVVFVFSFLARHAGEPLLHDGLFSFHPSTRLGTALLTNLTFPQPTAS